MQLQDQDSDLLEAVGDDQPARVFVADGLHQLANDRHVGAFGSTWADSFIRLKLRRSPGMRW